MWTSTPFIAETIAKIRAVLDARGIKYKIGISSQGEYADVAELDVPGAEMFLNSDPIWNMQKAIESDILVMAKSTFSYVSAVISDGVKVYERCGYPPLSDWVIRGPNGEFDSAAFEHQLQRRIESKEARKRPDGVTDERVTEV